MYTLIYELENVEAYFYAGDCVEGYLVVWRGKDYTSVFLNGCSSKLLYYLPTDENMIIRVSRELLSEAIALLEDRGNVRVEHFLDMTVSFREFRPYKPEEAVKLSVKHLPSFLQLKRMQYGGISEERAREILVKRRYYGCFNEDVLVSYACSYFKTPEVWVIGDVFTHPDHRGRGYAKIVTSAITRDAVSSGAKALLHVRSDNKPALKVYRRLGYKEVREQYWLIYTPRREKLFKG